MKMYTKCGVSALILLIALSCSSGFEFTQKDNEFDWKLIEKMLSSKNENKVLSPFTAKLLLSLVMQATDGSTNKELRSALLPHRKSHEFPYFFLASLKALEQSKHSKNILRILTTVLMNNMTVKRPSFALACRNYYNAHLVNIPFSPATNASSKVNELYKRLTKNKLTSVVTPDDFRDSSLLYINGIYFEGVWKHEFPSENSFDGTFSVDERRSETVTYMTNEAELNYKENSMFSMLELPYAENNFAMHIILPKQNSNLRDTLRNLDAKTFYELKGQYRKENLTVIIPKFDFKSDNRLREVLTDMGIQKVFTDSAEITEFTGGMLRISEIVQKAGISVDEKRSAAFAATVIQLEDKFAGGLTFKANKPFAYLIEDKVSGAILFAGQVYNPAE